MVVKMNPINLKGLKSFQGLLGKDLIQKEVEKAWRKKSKCLENLTDDNKKELEKIKLQLLAGLNYNGMPASILFEELKASKKITIEQKAFAKFLYENYPKHSIKAMGFD